MGEHIGMRVRTALHLTSKDITAKHRSPDTATRPTAIDKSYQGLYDEYLARKADIRIGPFLKLLYSNNLIDCGTNPRKSKLETRIKIQKFTYFAQRCFGLEFRYLHTLYIYGPYSPELANDYYRIQDIKDTPDGGLKDWIEKEQFLEFAKQHNDVGWLEVASTLVYLHKNDSVPVKDLIGHAGRIKYKFPKSQIEKICDELQKARFFKVE